jgi:hypothetical protein
VLLLVAPPAWAQGLDEQKATSKALFEQALACDNLPCACRNFEASLLVFERASTLVKVANCRRVAKNNVGAWQALSKARDVNRQDPAAYRASLEAEIEQELARIPTLQVDVPSPPPDLELRLDGQLMLVQPGQPVAIELGAHEVTATAPGYQAARLGVNVDGPRAYAVAISLQKAVAARSEPEPSRALSVPASPLTAPELTSTAALAGPAVDNPGGGQRTVGWVVGGVGIVGLGVAGALGWKTMALVDESNPDCDDENVCSGRGKSLRDSAGRYQTAAFIVGGVGVAALIGGIVLLVSAPGASSPEAAELGGSVGFRLSANGVSGHVTW